MKETMAANDLRGCLLVRTANPAIDLSQRMFVPIGHLHLTTRVTTWPRRGPSVFCEREGRVLGFLRLNTITEEASRLGDRCTALCIRGTELLGYGLGEEWLVRLLPEAG